MRESRIQVRAAVEELDSVDNKELRVFCPTVVFTVPVPRKGNPAAEWLAFGARRLGRLIRRRMVVPSFSGHPPVECYACLTRLRGGQRCDYSASDHLLIHRVLGVQKLAVRDI